MDVAVKLLAFAQCLGDFDHLPHRVVGILDDSAGEKQAFDVVATIKIHRQLHKFFARKTGPLIYGNGIPFKMKGTTFLITDVGDS